VNAALSCSRDPGDLWRLKFSPRPETEVKDSSTQVLKVHSKQRYVKASASFPVKPTLRRLQCVNEVTVRAAREGLNTASQQRSTRCHACESQGVGSPLATVTSEPKPRSRYPSFSWQSAISISPFSAAKPTPESGYAANRRADP
jgi:hypothetical protein